MKLYHFTSLKHLPLILKQGLTKGELPLDPRLYKYADRQAVNLTTNGDHRAQSRIWAKGGPTDKTKVRLTVEVPNEQLASFEQMRAKCKPTAAWVKKVAPVSERPKWFYVFGTVPPERIVKVEVKEGNYKEYTGTDLADLVARIEAEKERAFIDEPETSGPNKGMSAFYVRPGCDDSWLLDGKQQAAKPKPKR